MSSITIHFFFISKKKGRNQRREKEKEKIRTGEGKKLEKKRSRIHQLYYSCSYVGENSTGHVYVETWINFFLQTMVPEMVREKNRSILSLYARLVQRNFPPLSGWLLDKEID